MSSSYFNINDYVPKQVQEAQEKAFQRLVEASKGSRLWYQAKVSELRAEYEKKHLELEAELETKKQLLLKDLKETR